MKLNDKIKKIKVSYGNLIKDIQYDAKKRVVQVVLVGSLAPALVLASACTEEELLQAQHTIEQMTDNPDVIDTPDVVVEPPSVEPVVNDPVVEPEVVEPEEINPRDYSAVYDFDFEVPVYTEEEVEAARERLAENEEILKLIEQGNYSDEIIGKVSEDYYASRQEIIYQAYNSVKNVDTEAVSAGHGMVYYFDEKTGWAYSFTDELIHVLGCNNNGEYFSLAVSPKYYLDEEIKSCDRSMMTVAPNAFVDIASDEVIRSLIDTFKSRMDENPSIAIDEGILVNNGYIPIINSNEKILSK